MSCILRQGSKIYSHYFTKSRLDIHPLFTSQAAVIQPVNPDVFMPRNQVPH